MTKPSFLEFVCRRLLGEPSGSTYVCPYCSRRRLSVRPPKANLPIKWTCHRCQRWGDEFDLLRDVLGLRDYSDRLDKREALHAEYLRDEPADDFPRGDRGATKRFDPQVVAVAFSELASVLSQPVPDWAVGELAYLRFLVHAGDICGRNHLSLDALSGEVAKYVLMNREFHDQIAQTCPIVDRDFLREDDARAAELTSRLRPVTPDEWGEFKQKKVRCN